MGEVIVATFQDIYVALRLTGCTKAEALDVIAKTRERFTKEKLIERLKRDGLTCENVDALYERIIHGTAIDPLTGEKIKL